MGNNRHLMGLLPALALIGAALACSTPGAATPTDFVMVPGGTEPSAASPTAPETVESAPVPGQPTATTAPTEQAELPGASGTVRDILAFYPLAKGAYWTYHASITRPNDSGAMQQWVGTIIATVTRAGIDQGVPVFVTEWTGFPDFAAPEFGEHYEIVRDAGIYETTIDEKVAELAHSPVFTETAFMGWPLTVGGQWGDPQMLANHDGRYVWMVEAAETVKVPAGSFDGCYRAAFYTNPDTTIRWFCAGKGLVRYEYHHHGSVNDVVWELAAFSPGS